MGLFCLSLALSAFGAFLPMKSPQIRPGANWLSDNAENLLFLPFEISDYFPLERMKLMCNGESILVLITEEAKDVAESPTVQSFREKMDKMKKEAKVHEQGGEKRLHEKLQEWHREEDKKVKEMVKETFDHLQAVKKQKKVEKTASTAVPLSSLGISARIIRESLLIELPENGIDPSKVFALQRPSKDGENFSLYIIIPFEKSLTAASSGTAGALYPSKPIPIFQM